MKTASYPTELQGPRHVKMYTCKCGRDEVVLEKPDIVVRSRKSIMVTRRHFSTVLTRNTWICLSVLL